MLHPAGKYTSGSEKPPGPRGAIFSDDRLNQIDPLISLMRDIGSAHSGKTVAQVAINWVICKGVIPIVGKTSFLGPTGPASLASRWVYHPFTTVSTSEPLTAEVQIMAASCHSLGWYQ